MFGAHLRQQLDTIFAFKAARRLTGILIRVGIAQGLIQLVQIGTGVWIVRQSTKDEYAYYTIANTLLFTIVLLADSGITASLSALGGKAWDDKRALGTLLRTGLHRRRQMALIIAGLLIPVLAGLLIHNGASLLRTATITAVVVLTVFGELTIHTYLVVFRLRYQFNFTQKVALMGAAGRMLWLALLCATRLRAEIALLASSINTAIQCLLLRREIGDHAELDTARSETVEREMTKAISRQMPLNIYYCLQGQVSIWLASTFGSAHEISDIGALMRFGAIFTVSLGVMAEVFLPAFSRAQTSRDVTARYVQIVIAYLIFLIVALTTVILFKKQALSLLGPQYSRLEHQVPLAMGCAALSSLSQVLWGLNYSRAWILPPRLYILVTGSIQVSLLAFFRTYSVDDILWFTLLSLIPVVAFPVWLSISNIRLLATQEHEPIEEVSHV